MTLIDQNSVSSHHSIDDKAHQSNNANETDKRHEEQTEDNSSNGISSSTVNISFNAELRLRAYQEQRKIVEAVQSESETVHSENISLSIDTFEDKATDRILHIDGKSYDFPQNVSHMLTEVQNNIVKESEPGYQYLVNVLNNNMNTVDNPQQLQEIMRKEQFYLSRRKPFMQNSDFQSYSQVLNQFTNIVERQQYIHQYNF